MNFVLVVGVQAAWLRHRFTHAPASNGTLPQTDGTPLPPQMSGMVQVPQSAVSPPQPSLTRPQLAPACAQVSGTQGGRPPQMFAAPPPPQVPPSVQPPQS